MKVFLYISASILIVWFMILALINDLKVPSLEVSNSIKRALFIFPHPDDEVMTVSGLMKNLTIRNIDVSWLVLTRGEKGNESNTPDESLKTVRSSEARHAAQIYGIKNIALRDLPDGDLNNFFSTLYTQISDVIRNKSPDLVITYDPSGLYGHPDHIAVSNAVTQIIKAEYPSTKLWYVSLPEKIYDRITLPEEMADNENFINLRTRPTHKIWIGFEGFVAKVRSVYAYKSQKLAFEKSKPIKALPMWIYFLFAPFEYFHEVKN